MAAFGLAALTPATRPLLDDQRIAGLDRRQLAYQVLLRIPVGTVAWEEIAFRGVLQAALRRVLAEPAATVVGSAVFGLWHIRPTAEALAVNQLAAGRGARIAAVTAVAAGTAGAGALLSLLRERSGSLAAPVLLHLAANCAGPLASALARPGSAARPEGVAADETQHSGLGVRAVGYLDPGAELAGGADSLLHLFHPAEELSTEIGVQPVVLAGSPGQIPGVHEHVGGVELVDRGIQGQAADVRVGELAVRRLRIVQHRLHAVAVHLPRGDRVLVDRRPAGQVEAGAGGQERGEPFGQVANHVAGRPLGDRRWRVPGAGTAGPFGKKPGYLPVPLGRAVRQCHLRSCHR